jgi:hypothetical protein
MLVGRRQFLGWNNKLEQQPLLTSSIKDLAKGRDVPIVPHRASRKNQEQEERGSFHDRRL